MEFLQSILENSQYSVVTAIILGLMTAISPCPLATNISAIGFIGRDLENRRIVFIKGVVYTLGRAFSYTALALILFFGVSQMHISSIFQGWGEKVLGPLMVLIGLLMLDIIKIKFVSLGSISQKMQERSGNGLWGAFFLGVVFALAFCPYSGVIYFAMLMPITLSSTGGLVLPILFAIATGIPVIIFAWFLAYAMSNVGSMYNNIKKFELWFRRVIAVLFIGIGLYFIVEFFL